MSPASKSVSWVTGSYAVSNALRLIQAVVIARWLGPTEMGLYALALSILTLIELIERIGTNQLFISQSPNDETEQMWLLNCWTAQILMAGVASLIAICVALVAFSGDRVGLILLLLAILPPVMALKSARMLWLQKHRQFVSLAKFEIAAAFLRTVAPIAVVFFLRDVESLVVANIGATALVTAASHVVFRQRHRFVLDRAILREVVSFGSKSAYISALTTVHNTVDNLAVAGALGQAALGLYSTGYRLALMPLGLVQSVANRILTSQYRHAADKGLTVLVDHWRLAFRFLILLNAALMSVVILLAAPAVDLALGAEWSAAVPVIILSSFTAFFRGATLSISPLMMIRRQLHWDAVMKTIEVAVFLVFVGLGFWLQSLTVFLVGGIVSYALAFVLRVIWWRRHVVSEGLPPPPMEGMVLTAALLVMLAAYLATVFAAPLIWAALIVIVLTALPVLRQGKALIREMDR